MERGFFILVITSIILSKHTHTDIIHFHNKTNKIQVHITQVKKIKRVGIQNIFINDHHNIQERSCGMRRRSVFGTFGDVLNLRKYCEGKQNLVLKQLFGFVLMTDIGS